MPLVKRDQPPEPIVTEHVSCLNCSWSTVTIERDSTRYRIEQHQLKTQHEMGPIQTWTWNRNHQRWEETQQSD